MRSTIPESLDYTGVFDDIFAHYLKSVENAGVKTTGMGFMFRLSYKIKMKNRKEEKASASGELGAKTAIRKSRSCLFVEVRKRL